MRFTLSVDSKPYNNQQPYNKRKEEHGKGENEILQKISHNDFMKSVYPHVEVYILCQLKRL